MIYLLGDVHGHFDHVIEAVRRDRPAAVIFLGDLDCARPLHELIGPVSDLTDIWFIHGNHDTDSDELYRNLFESELADRNLHGRVAVIDGLRVAGLGGVFRGDIWYPPDEPSYTDFAEYSSMSRSGRTRLSKHDLKQLHATERPGAEMQRLVREGRLRKHRSSIFYADYERLWGQPADILVSYEAPSCYPHGFAAIDELVQSMGAKTAFHGHHHDNLDYRRFDSTLGFRAHGVGFCGVTDQHGNVIRPGDRDEARRYRATHPVSYKRDATFLLDVSPGVLSLIGDDSRFDIDLVTEQPGTATKILEFLSPYRRVMIIRDDEVAEAQLLHLLGTRTPAHISFSRPDTSEGL